MRSTAVLGDRLDSIEHFGRICSFLSGLPGHLGGPGFAPKSAKVAIGSIKAQLAAIVVGITKNIGLISSPIAKIINIGVNVATVAVLEFNSVRKIIIKTEIKIKI